MQICSGMQVGLKRDHSSFLLLYCDETSLRKYSPLIHSRFIMRSLKDHNHFVLMTETCKTKLVNKIRNIEVSQLTKLHHHKLSSQKTCACRELALHSLGKISSSKKKSAQSEELISAG